MNEEYENLLSIYKEYKEDENLNIIGRLNLVAVIGEHFGVVIKLIDDLKREINLFEKMKISIKKIINENETNIFDRDGNEVLAVRCNYCGEITNFSSICVNTETLVSISNNVFLHTNDCLIGKLEKILYESDAKK